MEVWGNPEAEGAALVDLIPFVISIHFHNQRNKDQPHQQENENQQDGNDYAHNSAKLNARGPEKE